MLYFWVLSSEQNSGVRNAELNTGIVKIRKEDDIF